MRISDWSSDVCSSDLILGCGERQVPRTWESASRSQGYRGRRWVRGIPEARVDRPTESGISDEYRQGGGAVLAAEGAAQGDRMDQTVDDRRVSDGREWRGAPTGLRDLHRRGAKGTRKMNER